MARIISEKQDLTWLSWSKIRESSGTAGSFMKAYSDFSGKKVYYKLSNYNAVDGIIGHECINEIIVDRLLNVLGIEHESFLFDGLEEALPKAWREKIWDMIWLRWNAYADLCNSR